VGGVSTVISLLCFFFDQEVVVASMWYDWLSMVKGTYLGLAFDRRKGTLIVSRQAW